MWEKLQATVVDLLVIVAVNGQEEKVGMNTVVIDKFRLTPPHRGERRRV